MKKTKKPASASPPTARRPSLKKWILLFVILVVVAVSVILSIHFSRNTADNVPRGTAPEQQTIVPGFRKDGVLSFLSGKDGSRTTKIDIEIAADEPSRNKGLMFRRAIPDAFGMLFIFDDSAPRSFWMENTYIPLDIMFADENKQITTIRKNTVPFSKASVLSDGDAKYVIEVTAGFSELHGLQAGDSFEYYRD